MIFNRYQLELELASIKPRLSLFMSHPTIYRFDPFELSHGSNTKWHQHLLKVMNYAECRLRHAIVQMSRQRIEKQHWMQSYLRSEVVC